MPRFTWSPDSPGCVKESFGRSGGRTSGSQTTLIVVASMSAGVDTTTKSGKWRAVPITTDAFVALDGLSQRERFTGEDDYVFCWPDRRAALQ